MKTDQARKSQNVEVKPVPVDSSWTGTVTSIGTMGEGTGTVSVDPCPAGYVCSDWNTYPGGLAYHDGHFYIDYDQHEADLASLTRMYSEDIKVAKSDSFNTGAYFGIGATIVTALAMILVAKALDSFHKYIQCTAREAVAKKARN